MSFVQDFNKGLDQAARRALAAIKTRPITSGSIHQDFKKLCEQADIGQASLHYSSSPIPNAFAMPGNHIVITEGTFKILGGGLNLPLTPEMKFMIGHEMGHVNRGILSQRAKQIGVITGIPLLAVAAKRRFLPIDADEKGTPKGNMKQAIGDGIVGAGGFVVGTETARVMAHIEEFRADIFGAKLTSPDIAIDSLNSLQNNLNRVMRTANPKDPIYKMSTPNSAPTPLGRYVQSRLNAHPDLSLRIDVLEKLKTAPSRLVQEVEPIAKLIVNVASKVH